MEFKDLNKACPKDNYVTYYYKAMPFDLWNTGATYQRVMNTLFKEKIGKSMEVYVDEMLVKRKQALNHVIDLT